MRFVVLIFLFLTKVSLFAQASNFLLNETALFNDDISESWGNTFIKEQVSHTGNKVAYIDTEHPYGFGYKKKINDAFLGKNIKLIVESWIKTEDVANPGLIVIQLMHKDSNLFWNSINLSQKINIKNTWTFISDTFIIARSLLLDKENSIVTFMWNNTGKVKTEGDDFSIKAIELEMPSFIPEIKAQVTPNFYETLFKGNYYSIVYDKQQQLIGIADKNGNNIVSLVEFYEDVLLNTTNVTTDQYKFLLQQKTDSLFIFLSETNATKVILTVFCEKNNPKLRYKVLLQAKTSYTVNRQTLLMKYTSEVKEVYRKNTLVDTTHFQTEYWLNKEGCKIGTEQQSLITYRNNQLNSLQLNTSKKILSFNFDYKIDHTLIHFPLRKDDKKGIKQDVSSTPITQNEERIFEFSLYLGTKANNFPVFMQQPNAYLSTFIFTEHADYTDLKTNYAVYYGSSEITKAKKASGGFCKYNIPVTKSIFYHNPEHLRNKDFNGEFSSEMSSWKNDKKYQKFIRDLYKKGNEIAIHTPEYTTTNRKYLEKALSKFSHKYKTITWIDHGYDNGVNDNREDFACDGLDKNSPVYSLDLWNKYKIKYIWNCFNEDSSLYGKLDFAHFLKNPYLGYGDVFPTSIYWKNKQSGNDIISWTSHGMLDFKDENLWNYYFNKATLNDLVQNREIFIAHAYPARVDSVQYFYSKTDDGKFIVNQKFEQTLSLLNDYRNKNEINITTVKKYLDYSLALENIEWAITKNELIQLKNNNPKEIKGFTFYVKNQLKNTGNMKLTKLKTGGYLYTFDFKPNTTITIE